MIRRLCVYILVLLVCAACCSVAQDTTSGKKMTPADERAIAQVLAIDPASVDPGQRQRLFDTIQRLISIAQMDRTTYITLLEALTEKQLKLFPDEKKSYVDAATVHLKADRMQQMHDVAKAGLSKPCVYYTGDKGPLDASLLTMIGQYLVEKREYKKAYAVLSKAVTMEQQIPLAFYLLGNAAYNLGKFDECQNAYSFGVMNDIEPAYPLDFYYYAKALHHNGFTEKAEKILNVAMYRYPNEPGLPLNMGNMLLEQNKLIEALLAFYREQLIFGQGGRFFPAAKAAIDMTEDLIERRNDPREKTVLQHLNQWNTYMERTEFDKAAAEIKKAVEVFGSYNWTLMFFLYMAYLHNQQFGEARQVIESMNRIDPGVVIHYIALAEINVGLYNLQDAREWIDKAREADPDNWKLKEFENRLFSDVEPEKDN